MTVKILNRLWDEALLDKTSEQFQTLSNDVTRAVSFKNSTKNAYGPEVK